MNLVVIAGRLSGPPAEKVLPSGTRIMSMQVTVEGGTGRADSVPVAWFDPPAVAVELDEGDEIVVLGRVRRRFFRLGATTASRTEVLAERVVPAGRPAAVRTALAAAVERLASALEPDRPATRRSRRSKTA